jgi:hypothetical protein
MDAPLGSDHLFNEQGLEDRADRAVLEDHLLLQLAELVECHM